MFFQRGKIYPTFQLLPAPHIPLHCSYILVMETPRGSHGDMYITEDNDSEYLKKTHKKPHKKQTNNKAMGKYQRTLL